jgi:hypothetical protein
VLHDKIDDVAMRATAEAMIELLVVVDGEGWAFLAVERAAGLELAPGADHPHLAADDLGQGEARAQFIQVARGNRHALTYSKPAKRVKWLRLGIGSGVPSSPDPDFMNNGSAVIQCPVKSAPESLPLFKH